MPPSMAPGRQGAEHSGDRPARRGIKAQPVSDAERDRIRELHTLGKSCNAIAIEIGRSRSTVSDQCRKMGLSFDRTQTADAVRAHRIDAKARRAALAEAFLANAERLNAQMFAPYEDAAPVGGAEPTVLRWHRDEPSFADKEKIARGAGVLADKHMRLADFDASGEDSSTAQRSVIGRLITGLAGAVAAEAPESGG